MEILTITKGGKKRKITRSAWENNMPANKDGWTIAPSVPKEVKKKGPLKIDTGK